MRLRVYVRVNEICLKCFVGASFECYGMEIRRRYYCTAFFSQNIASLALSSAMMSANVSL